MLGIPTPPPTNVNATAIATATAANVSAITKSPNSTPVVVIGLKSIGAMIPNVVGNRGGSGAAQMATNANTKKGLGCFSQLNSLVAAQKAVNPNNQKGLGCFSQLNPLVKRRLWPGHSTHRA
jgi:hypothetical protein